MTWWQILQICQIIGIGKKKKKRKHIYIYIYIYINSGRAFITKRMIRCFVLRARQIQKAMLFIFTRASHGLTYYLGMDSGTLRDLSHYIYICMKNSTNEAGILFFIFWAILFFPEE